MDVTTATMLVTAVEAYAAAGALFAAAFVSTGVTRLDPQAQGAGVGFRLLIVPGTIALWPVLAYYWLSGRRLPRPERNAHRPAAGREPAPHPVAREVAR